MKTSGRGRRRLRVAGARGLGWGQLFKRRRVCVCVCVCVGGRLTSSAANAAALGLIASINLNAKVRDTGARRRRWTSPLENSMLDLTKSKTGPEIMPCINFASVSIWRVTSRVISSRC